MEAKQFGQFIAGIRKEKKMTQAELAEKIHVTDKAISRWERGLGFPDIQTLEPLAQVLGISVLELMRSEKKKPTGDMDTTETQYTQKEVAEMLQNADDISKQLKKQDKNANIIAGILVIGVGTLAWATKIASLGGGLVLGGLSAAVFVSLWYFLCSGFCGTFLTRHLFLGFCYSEFFGFLECLLNPVPELSEFSEF